MTLRSERMASKTITNCSLKNTTGSMLGRPPLGIQLAHPLSDKREVELRLQVAVEVVGGDKVLHRDGDRLVETAGFGRAEHDEAPGRTSILKGRWFPSVTGPGHVLR
jgi:hypothetical protein